MPTYRKYCTEQRDKDIRLARRGNLDKGVPTRKHVQSTYTQQY